VSETRKYLEDLLDHISAVAEFTSGGHDAFLEDRKTQFAVIRAYEVIGEITKRIPSELLETQPSIEWGAIKGFRDFLAHNYERVRLDIVWSAVEKLPTLKSAVKTMLESLDTESDDEQT
jgi:uncharacterized protein with HEPN domain